jgi:hypothetical protein
MKTNSDNEDALLEAVLRDESWQADDANFKQKAMGVFHARQRRRRVTRWAAGLSAAALLALLALHPAPKSIPPARQASIDKREPAKPKAAINYMTDAELLAAFPPGSCMIAEVNGQKKFFFPNAEPKAGGENGE